MRAVKFWLVGLLLLYFAGCTHSHVIKINIVNESDAKISNIVVDYPGATFGVNSLSPGKNFPYTIKPTEDKGTLKIQFVDANGMTHQATGPEVHRNDEGTIEIKLSQNAARSGVHINQK
jgi:hypothetical protein